MVGKDDSCDVPPLPPTVVNASGETIRLYPDPGPMPIREGYYAFTGEDGKYRIDGVLPGEYNAIAVRPGLESDHHPVTVAANSVSQVDFTLTLIAFRFGVMAADSEGRAGRSCRLR